MFFGFLKSFGEHTIPKEKKKSKMSTNARNARRVMVGGTRTLHTPQSNVFELTKINQLNGDSIYRITVNGCWHYFYGCHKKYVLTCVNDEYYLVTLDASPQDLPIELIRRIEEFLPITTMKTKYALVHFLNEMDAEILYWKHRECHQRLDLTNAKMALRRLNELLQRTCPNACLQLDYVYDHHPPAKRLVAYRSDPSSLILCLYVESGCMSSIMITMEGAHMTIDSATDSQWTGRKYNKLLRCTVILLARLLSTQLQRVTSHAINPISAYLLLHYFDGSVSHVDENGDFFNWVEDEGIAMDSETDHRRILDRYQQSCKQSLRCFELMVHIELTDDSVEKAERVFSQIVAEMAC